MTRSELIRKLGRYFLLMIMGIIIIFLGNKIVTGSDCSACAGKGICSGKTDCNKYK